MREVALHPSFLESHNELNKQEQKVVYQKVKKLTEGDINPGFKIHKLERSNCDPSFRSARINRDLRVIFSQTGKTLILLHVNRHDQAYRWAEGKYLDVNNFNSLYLRDDELTSLKVKKLKQKEQPQKKGKSLLEGVGIRQKDLEKLGLSKVHAGYLLEIEDEDSFFDFIEPFPQEIQEGLIDLITGVRNLTQVYADLEDEVSGGEMDRNRALKHRDSRRRFYLVHNQEEFADILDQDMEAWKLFLHPQQEKLVRGNFQGPVLIEGGPGTGKTVVGMHRALYLAEKIYPASREGRILFCTFSKKLAGYINEKVGQLTRQRGVDNNIEVRGVDQVINTVLNQQGIEQGRLDLEGLNEIWQEVYLEIDPAEPLSFFQTEYEEVIQKNRIDELEEYLEIERTGQGRPLQPSQRRLIWPVFAEFIKRKREAGLIDFEDRANILISAREKGEIQPIYDSVIIDEAQDLSGNKLRALYSLVRSRNNNLMLLSDQNQRIFRLGNWKRETGIPIVGRTYYLSLNYRMSRQIREYADRQFMFSRPEKEHLLGFKSLFGGPEPVEKEFSREKDQHMFICSEIRRLLTAGFASHEICVVAPAHVEKISGVLDLEDIPYQMLKGEEYPRAGQGVALSTMHGVKGLEFRAVIIPYYNRIGHWLDKEEIKADRWYCWDREGQVDCLRYVAATRAREELIISSLQEE